MDSVSQEHWCASGPWPGAASSWNDVIKADVSFHMSIVVAAGSPRLLRIYNTIATEMALVQVLVQGLLSTSEMVDAHRDLHEAILSGDRERALQALDCHIQWSFEELIERLPANEQPCQE